MDFCSLEIENFLTIGEAKVDLQNKGLVLIQGVNEDDDSANSNGAGKSSVVDALCWCLYGKTARGVSADSVINITEKKNCRVSVSVDDDGVLYTITRHRKHKKGKNRLEVHMIDKAGKPSDLTKGTDKLTQPLVEQIIGSSYEVFTAAIYAGQEAMPDLPGMSDKQLKTLIEEAAGVDRLQAAYTTAREKMRGHQEKVLRQQAHVQSANSALATANANLQRLEKACDEWIGTQVIKIQQANDYETACRQRHKDAVLLCEPQRLQEVQAELRDVTAQIAGTDAERKEEKRLSVEASNWSQQFAIYKQQLQDRANETRRLKTAAENVQNEVGTPCKECGKPIEEADVEPKQVIANQRLTDAVAQLRDLKAKTDSAQGSSQSASERLSEFQRTMTDISAAVALQQQLSSERARIERLDMDAANARADIERAQRAVAELEAQDNPYIKLVDEAQSAVTKATEIQQAETAAEKQLAADVPLYEAAVAVFSPAGVRAHILDTVTPYLNERTSHYLGTLSDGNLSAVWSTIGFTTKGDAREKFNIEVSNGTGADSFAGLSGGEKRKVRLSCSLALQDLVASRASKSLSLFVGDEIDHALDDAGLERLMGILDEKAKQRGTVLVISHNDLADWCRQTAIVTKRGGKATISGVL